MHTTIDPVCGMEVSVENAEEKSEHAGRTYYFCSAACRNKFDENPAQYADRAGAKAGGPETR